MAASRDLDLMGACGALEAMRPRALRAGCTEAFVAEGWAFDQRHATAAATLRIGASAIPAVAVGIERSDIAMRHESGPQRSPYAATSGLLVAGVVGPFDPGVQRFRLELELVTGATVVAAEGDIRVDESPAVVQVVADAADVAIAMATFDPPLELFRRQIESIREQQHESWVCIVCDDGSALDHLSAMREILGTDRRFTLIENRRRVGFYLNFERALSAVPRSASFVALCDQDDWWHPEKLARQVAVLTADDRIQMVATDVRVTDEDGSVLAPTFYAHRASTYDDPYSLFMVNSLIGASMVLRRSLLDVALPFPRSFEDRFHDHWLARSALVLGDVSFVGEPLHDYVQHGANVFGDRRATQWPLGPVVKPLVRTLAGGGPLPAAWRDDFVNFPLECSVSAQLLQRRCPDARSQPWLARIVSLHDGQLRELSQICVDHARERRSERPRRENVELALFTGRSWAMHHQPRALRT